jgi:hypothetical protein
MPPGAPEEKQSNVVITRAIKINSSRPTEKLPAAAIGIRLKPPPRRRLNQPENAAHPAD